MAEEYYQLSHTGEQIDNAIKKLDDLDNVINKNNDIIINTIYNNKIQPLETRMDNFETKIKTDTVSISKYNKDITAINGRINVLGQENNDRKDDIEQLTTFLSEKVESKDYQKDVSELKRKDQALENQIENRISELKQNLNNTITGNTTRSVQNETDIKAIKNQIEKMGNIQELRNSLSSLSQTYNEFIANDFTNTKKTANDALAAVGQLQATHQTDIEGIQATLNDIPNTYETQENFTSFVTNTFNPLSEEIYGENGVNSQIASLQTQISELQKQIANLQKQIDDLKGSTP